nr:cell wall protein DAN4 [Megalopta genalis]
MYGRQGEPGNTQPPPWLVRAEVTIRHSTPTTSESGETPPVTVSSSVTDSGGVRMVYRWSTSQSPPSSVVAASTSSQSVPSASSSSFGFQRGNILFTSTPPPRPSPSGFYTIPRSGSSGNEESSSSRGRGVPDSGYNSEQYSPQTYSSLPTRRPSQQYNRRCKSTCSIVLSAVDVADGSAKETSSKIATSESAKHSYDHSWRHHSSQHVFSRQFTTVPEVEEEESASGTTTAQLSRDNKVATRTIAVSKDAASQTTDIECKESSSTVFGKSKVRRKAATGLLPFDEQKKKKQESESPSAASETASLGPSADSEKSDSSAKDDSSRRKSRTVHIDVYCTGTEDDDNSETSDNERDTPSTVFENPDVRVTHTQVPSTVLPRGFQDEKAFLKRATERKCDSFKHAPMRMPSIASSKGYDSDDMLSSLYPSQFSSYSALRDLDSVPWSADSSNVGFPFEYDSAAATSCKDTFSDIESLVASRSGLTPCDSFEYASSSDRERIRRMEETWAKSEEKRRAIASQKYLSQGKKMKDYMEKHEAGWSSADSGEESDESGTVGWSFVSSEESQKMVKMATNTRRNSKEVVGSSIAPTAKEDEPSRKQSQQDLSDSTTRSDSIPQPHSLRDQVRTFESKSPSPLPSKMPSRVTSPFMTPQGERTDHIIKASIFGRVVNAFRKPGHHIGPSKNPNCSCDHCRRYFEELNSRDRSGSISEFERQTGFRLQNEKKIVRSIPKNCGS